MKKKIKDQNKKNVSIVFFYKLELENNKKSVSYRVATKPGILNKM